MNDVYIRKEDLGKWIAKYFERKDLISIDDLICCIEDLDSEIDNLKYKIEELEQDIEENYRPISKAEQYDVNECDFI